MRLLVVEDDPEIAGFLLDGLRQEGHEAAVAGDGETALEHAARGHPSPTTPWCWT